MNPYGRYTVSYTPSDDPCEYLQVSTQMSISGEASLPDMLNFLTDFLRASGYVFEGELEIVTGEEKATFNSETNPDDYFFGGAGVVGGVGNDVISFG
jgi:hypothetical protein